jgi:glycosyltransferase involved in cell wall biosynthesis
MLHGATIVGFSSIDWAFSWQIPQEVTARFAAAGNRVLYVETTGVRRPGLRDAARLRERLGHVLRSRGRARTVLDSPVIVPLPYSRLACRINAALLHRTIRGWAGPRGRGPLVFLTFVPTPLAREVSRRLDPTLVVYYCCDRLAESSPGARPLVAHERALFGDADLVFTTSDGLQQAALEHTPRAVQVVSGVRFDEFQRAREAGGPPPPWLDGLSRPVVGYLGSLRDELDIAMLADVAARAPDIGFLFIGPIVTDVTRLAACRNVRFAGSVPHTDVPGAMSAFDVGLLPYVLNGYTSHVRPVKLAEYLAAGLPVVSTGLPEVHRFVAEHGPIVSIADGAEAFLAAIRRELAGDGPARVARRVDVARRYDWAGRIETMSGVIERALGGSGVRRVAV